MIRLLSIFAVVFIMGTIASTFQLERVEIVKKHEWDLPQEVQDSIQLVQEEGFRAYSDYVQLRCEQVNSVIGVCKLAIHQNDLSLDYITNGHPMKCGCYNTNYE